MSEFYHAASRQLQDRFDTRRLADRLEERIVGDILSEDDRALIERMEMFFLATADADGKPQCSYKVATLVCCARAGDRRVPELSSLRA